MAIGLAPRALAVCFGALLAAACGAGPEASRGHETAVTVTDSSITATPAALAAGDVTLNINPDSIYTGALGGATFAWRAVQEEGKTAEARA